MNYFGGYSYPAPLSIKRLHETILCIAPRHTHQIKCVLKLFLPGLRCLRLVLQLLPLLGALLSSQGFSSLLLAVHGVCSAGEHLWEDRDDLFMLSSSCELRRRCQSYAHLHTAELLLSPTFSLCFAGQNPQVLSSAPLIVASNSRCK